MGRKFKIRPIGNSYGIIIPKPILEEHNLKLDDNLELFLENNNFIFENNNFIFAKVDGMHDKNKKIKRDKRAK
jgi:antitoxin component of MazEF toxin-antitoxin module